MRGDHAQGVVDQGQTHCDRAAALRPVPLHPNDAGSPHAASRWIARADVRVPKMQLRRDKAGGSAEVRSRRTANEQCPAAELTVSISLKSHLGKAAGSGFRRPTSLRDKQSLDVDRVPQDTGSLHRFDPLRTVRHRTGFFEGSQRFDFQIQSRQRVLDRSSHGLERYLVNAELSDCPGSRAVHGFAFDSRGSQSSILVSAWAHFGHS